MTVVVALEHLKPNQKVRVSQNAFNSAPSKADLTLDAEYRAGDLMVAALVASSNDAAVALAEASAGSEADFVDWMNKKASQIGMKNTYFVNATGLTAKRQKQYSTAYDLTRLLGYALRDKRIDRVMGMQTAQLSGNDGKVIGLRNHNRMLWRMPKTVKGKTGWTFASRHTFVGTDYTTPKHIFFAMLRSQKPWIDIEHLASLGFALKAKAI